MPANSTRLKLVRCRARSTTRPGRRSRRVTGQHVLSRGGALVGFEECGQLGDGIGIVRRIFQNRRLFEVEVGVHVDESGRAQCDDPTHAVVFAASSTLVVPTMLTALKSSRS